MSERRQWSEHELDRALTEVGRRLAYPEPPDVAASVARRLAAGPYVRPLTPGAVDRRRGRNRIRRSFVALAAALALALTAILVASPSVRRAVAGWLGLPGVRIEVAPSPPAAPRKGLGAGLRLGERVSLQEAQRRVDYDILTPAASSLGSPDAVYLSSLFGGGQVFLVYRSRPGLPEALETGAGLLLSEFRGSFDRELVRKSVGPQADVEPVSVNGAPGFWIEGAPHVLFLLDELGRVVPNSVRLADNVLLWQQGELTLRLESALSKDEALRIASSVQ